jgi:hypothetical protein
MKYTEFTRVNGKEWEEAEWSSVEPIEADSEEEALRIALDTEKEDLDAFEAKQTGEGVFEYYNDDELVTLEIKVEEEE